MLIIIADVSAIGSMRFSLRGGNILVIVLEVGVRDAFGSGHARWWAVGGVGGLERHLLTNFKGILHLHSSPTPTHRD